MLNYLKAFFIMFMAHRHQKDKGEHYYFFHPFRVSLNVKALREKVVALLHDVPEDSDKFSVEHLNFLDEEQIKALKLLTHDKSVNYFDYIEKIITNELARKVKIADLNDNMNLSRLEICNTRRY